MKLPLSPLFIRCTCLATCALFFLDSRPLLRAENSTGRSFELPPGPAEDTLKEFSRQSGRGIVAGSQVMAGVQTNSVEGTLTPREAIDRMLDGTGLRATEDEQTGAFAVRREAASAALPAATPSPTPVRAEPGATVTLDPFEVKTDSDKSYGALSSRSITAFDTQLDHLPVSADIFDQAFMNDVGATSLEGMLSYSAGAGFSGLNGPDTITKSQPGDYQNQSYLQIRGMTTPTIQRDSLMYMGSFGAPGGTGPGTTSNFDLERVEVIFGPQSMLYDGGGAGGVINAVSKQARLGAPAFGSEEFRIDQDGSKYNLLDYGAGTDRFAIRVAAVNATDDTRRINIGNRLDGLYTQLAATLWNTTVRVSLEQTTNYQVFSSEPNLTSTGDPNYKQFNNYDLTYLLATGQAEGIAGGLNWSNVNSLEGNFSAGNTVADFGEVEFDTKWTDWLTTQVSGGLSDETEWHTFDLGSIAFYSPGATSNTLPGNWTNAASANFSANERDRPFRGKAGRVSALLTNNLFGGRAKSQSIVGIDYVGTYGANVDYAYYQADSNWNLSQSPSVTTNLGRTYLPPLSWTVNNGSVYNPFFQIGAPRITYNGQNYILQQVNPYNKALVTVANPIGTSIVGGQNELHNEGINEGVYASNDTKWLNDRLDTLLGVRLEHAYRDQVNQTGINVNESRNFNFSAGADYHVLPWLAPYFNVSNSYLLPPQVKNDETGQLLPVSEALGEELGVKINNAEGTMSGSVALYHNQAKNEEFLLTGALLNDISPTGLNGRAAGTGGGGYDADTESDGVEVTLTANPVKNWRMRLSAAYTDGRIQSTRTYAQFYDDQFYENGQGQVTYADGTVVYVAPTYNSKTPAYTAANAPAGSVPLTVTKLSTPSDLYYANPNLSSGQINSSSDAAKVLTSTDPIHGTILTGANGLPVSALQLVPSPIPGLSIPGSIPVAIAGDHTTGYPEIAVVFTSVYEFSTGWLKGFEAGGSVRLGWKDRAFYYFAQGLGGTFAPVPYFNPDFALFEPLAGYSHKLGRFTFSSRLNIYNVFNHYHVVIYPDQVTGWSNPANLVAAFDQQPRRYMWTNTIKF